MNHREFCEKFKVIMTQLAESLFFNLYVIPGIVMNPASATIAIGRCHASRVVDAVSIGLFYRIGNRFGVFALGLGK